MPVRISFSEMPEYAGLFRKMPVNASGMDFTHKCRHFPNPDKISKVSQMLSQKFDNMSKVTLIICINRRRQDHNSVSNSTLGINDSLECTKDNFLNQVISVNSINITWMHWFSKNSISVYLCLACSNADHHLSLQKVLSLLCHQRQKACNF